MLQRSNRAAGRNAGAALAVVLATAAMTWSVGAPASAAAQESAPALDGGVGQPVEPAPDPAAPTVGASLDRTEAHVGDRLTLTVSAVARTAVADSIRLARRELGRFEVLDDSTADRDLGDGKKSRRFVLQIAAYEVGILEVPPITVEYLGAGGESRRVTTAAIPVRIGRIVEDSRAEMQPLQKPHDLLVEDRRWVQGLAAAGAALALALVGLAVRSFVRRWRRRPRAPVEPLRRPAHDVALERLQALRDGGRFGESGYRPFHFELSEILRGYLGDRFGFDSLELTTTELLEELQALSAASSPTARIDAERSGLIARFLEECDLVKFAKAGSSDEAAFRLLATAEEVVRATMAGGEADANAKPAAPTHEAEEAAHG